MFAKIGTFWSEAVRLDGSVTLGVWRRVAIFGLTSLFITLIHFDKRFPELSIEVTPFEFAGAVVGTLLVLRTNAGYERWWEGRKLWGGIVNQSRSLAIAALAYGPQDPEWRNRVVRHAASFCHVARHSLRGEREMPDVAKLMGESDTNKIIAAKHMPSAMAKMLADDLRQNLSGVYLLQVDNQKVLLMDHIGGCERIMKTPLPLAYTIEIRRLIIMYLLTLPLALLDRIGFWTPLLTVFVAYPLLALDKIGVELQNPFSATNLNHLPLDDICAMIEADLLDLLGSDPGTDNGNGHVGDAVAASDPFASAS